MNNQAGKKAHCIRNASILAAINQVTGERRSRTLRAVKEETGYSLSQIIDRCPTMMEASLQAGVSYQTVRRYVRRWK